MEQNIRDFLTDAFLDTGLPSYQEEDLNFDNLNFGDLDAERTENMDFGYLPVLKEAEENSEQKEKSVDVYNSLSERECQQGTSEVLPNQCPGQIQYIETLNDNGTQETGSKWGDLKEAKDEDEKQDFSNKEREENKDEVVQETNDSAEEDEGVVQGTCSKERTSIEDEDEIAGMDDFSSPSYLSQVTSLEEKEEITDYAGRQFLFQDEDGTSDEKNTMTQMIFHLLPPHLGMQMEGRVKKMGKKEGKIIEEKEVIVDGNTPLEKYDLHGQFLLHDHQFSGDLKEFSEDDQGVIGEDYAEYPLECFQQGDTEDRNKEVGEIKAESTQETRKLDGSGQPRVETFEWELLERHTNHILSKETRGDVLKECDDFVWGEITEEQVPEEKLLKDESVHIEQKDMGRHTEGERSMLDDVMASYLYSLSDLYDEELEKTESLKDTKEHEFSEEDFTEVNDTHERFGDKQDESGDKLQCKNEAEYFKETAYDQKKGCESNFSHPDNDDKQDFQELERNDSHPMRGGLLENLGVWDTGTSTMSSVVFGTDSNSNSEDGFSQTSPFESSNHPIIWPNDGKDPVSSNFSEKTASLIAGDPTETTKYFVQEISWKTEMSTEELTSKDHPTALLEHEGSFNYDNIISPEKVGVGQDLTDTGTHEGEELVEEITARLYSEHEEHSSVGMCEHEFHYDDDDDENEEVPERNWEQENERIEAFNRYYNDYQNGADAAEDAALNNSERKHTVRFCLQPNFPTDSSDLEDGVSTSSEEVEECSRAVTRRSLDLEEDCDGKRRKEDLALLLQQSQATQRELLKLSTELKVHCRKNKFPGVLYACLKISLLTVLGILFFWWATEKLEWMH